jgi:N-acetylneuraminate lyase
MTARTPSPLTGLVAATHTPFTPSGALHLAIVEPLAAFLFDHGVKTVFIGGSTGESHSLTVDERRALAQRWCEVTRGTPMRVVVHVGSNCLADARALAAQAATLGASAISALAPSYFKPRSINELTACCAEIALMAPDLPFYFYDIPVLTHVHLSMPDFLDHAVVRIPNLAGLKFTNPDLMAYQLCLHRAGGTFDILWGIDECLLAALVMGGHGAVGSSYNFAAPLYHRLIDAFNTGNLDTARREQFHSVQLIQTLARHGYLGASKAIMAMLGVNVGPVRLPHTNPTAAGRADLQRELEQLGYFEWIRS